ncbi:MAG: MarR family winged helix-turn-helix transcriptional regulator [Planctomycetaceae bacterium]
MLHFDFQSSIGYWICMTAHQYERAMNLELTPEGITHRQCQVLAWLALEGDLSQVELADRMNIEPSTLVRVLDRMERDGLIVRGNDPHDRRKKMIRPAGNAPPVWNRIVACAERVRSRAIDGLTAEQLETLKRLLAIVQANLGRTDALKETA